MSKYTISDAESYIDDLCGRLSRLRAVNAKLVEACERLIRSCQGLVYYIATGMAKNQQREADEAIVEARAALAAAKEADGGS